MALAPPREATERLLSPNVVESCFDVEVRRHDMLQALLSFMGAGDCQDHGIGSHERAPTEKLLSPLSGGPPAWP